MMNNKRYIPESLKELKRQSVARKFNLSSLSTPKGKGKGILGRSMSFSDVGDAKNVASSMASCPKLDLGESKPEISKANTDKTNLEAQKILGPQIAVPPTEGNGANRPSPPTLQRNASIRDFDEVADRRRTQFRRQNSGLGIGTPSRPRRSNPVDGSGIDGAMGLSLHLSSADLQVQPSSNHDSLKRRKNNKNGDQLDEETCKDTSIRRRSSLTGARRSSLGGATTRRRSSATPSPLRSRRGRRGSLTGGSYHESHKNKNLTSLLSQQKDDSEPACDDVSIDDTAKLAPPPCRTSQNGASRDKRDPILRRSTIGERSPARASGGRDQSSGTMTPGRRRQTLGSSSMHQSTKFGSINRKSRSTDMSAFCTPLRKKDSSKLTKQFESSAGDLSSLSIDDISIDDSVKCTMVSGKENQSKKPDLVKKKVDATMAGVRQNLRRNQGSSPLPVSSDHGHRTAKKRLPPRSKTADSSTPRPFGGFGTPIESKEIGQSPFASNTPKVPAELEDDHVIKTPTGRKKTLPRRSKTFDSSTLSPSKGLSTPKKETAKLASKVDIEAEVNNKLPDHIPAVLEIPTPSRSSKPKVGNPGDIGLANTEIRRTPSPQRGDRQKTEDSREEMGSPAFSNQKPTHLRGRSRGCNVGEGARLSEVSNARKPTRSSSRGRRSPSPALEVTCRRQPSNVWQCRCGFKCDKRSNFCGICGSKQHWTCSGCGEDSNMCIFAFCAMCGQAKDGPASTTEKRSRLPTDSPSSVIMTST